ncbi:MAG: hypothetical protein F6K56_28255 [Moorea sp. SIO3G5]|nr:hypothetical protein [Moorena sp. SIO3G5]
MNNPVSIQWSVVSGQRSVVSGQWSAVSGQRSVVSGQLMLFKSTDLVAWHRLEACDVRHKLIRDTLIAECLHNPDEWDNRDSQGSC